jgi:hypothetical protein
MAGRKEVAIVTGASSLTRPAGVKRFLALFCLFTFFFLLDQAHLYAFAQERRVALPIF